MRRGENDLVRERLTAGVVVQEHRLTRFEVADVVAGWAGDNDLPLFVGNGFLPRQVAQHHDKESNLYLMGGMGLALPVALGFVQAHGRDRPAVVLEGDGNFYMGVAAAHLCGGLGAPILHVVADNGIYESSGGQQVPCSRPRDLAELARAFGYRSGAAVDDRASLVGRLTQLGTTELPALLFASTAPDGAPPPRIDLTPDEVAARFRGWAIANATGL